MKGKGAVDSGPADSRVVPTADAVGHTKVLELLSGNGGEAVVAEDAAVSFRGTEEVFVRKLVGSVATGAGNVVLVGPAVEVGGGAVPVMRVAVDTSAEVALVRGNGAEIVLALGTLVVTEVDLLVVRMTDALVVVDTGNTVCELGPTVDVVLFRNVEELEVGNIVVLGVKIDKGNVLRVDTGEVELVRFELLNVVELSPVRLPTDGEAVIFVDVGGGVMGGKLVSIVTLVRFPDGEELNVRVGPEVTAAEEVLLTGAVAEVVKTTDEFFEKEFLSVKLGNAELFKASALVSVIPESVDDIFEARLEEIGVGVGVGVGVEVEVAITTVVEVLEVGIVVTVHGPFVCLLPWCGCLQCGR